MRRALTGLLYIAVAVVAIAGASVSRLPAQWAVDPVARATSSRVTLANVAGTIWQGRGDVTLARLGPGMQPTTVRNVEWTVEMLPILFARVSARLRFIGPEVTGQADISSSKQRLLARGARVVLPATLVASSIPAARGWDSPGMIEVKADSVGLTPRGVIGAAEVFWRGAQAAGLGALGEYRLAINGVEGAPAKLQLSTLSGQLQLDGSGEYAVPQRFEMKVVANGAGPNRDRILPMLSLIGAPRADGSVALDVGTPPAGGAMVKQSNPSGRASDGDAHRQAI